MRDEASRMPRFAPEVEALLAHERTIPPPYDFTRARVLARARKSLKDGNLASFTAPTLASHHLPYAALAGLAIVVATAAFQVLRSSRPGSTMHAELATNERATQRIALPKQAPLVEQKVDALPFPVEPEGTTGPLTERPPVKRDTAIEELALLERAQIAATRGDHTTVLVITRDHETRYPRGRLNEEREALRVRAMIGLGRLDEARQAAARFHRSFPHSVLLARLDDMLGSR